MNGTEVEKLLMLGVLLGVLVFAIVAIAVWRKLYGAQVRKERAEKYKSPRRKYQPTTWSV